MFTTGLFDARPQWTAWPASSSALGGHELLKKLFPVQHLHGPALRHCFNGRRAWPDDFEVIDGSQHHEPYRDIAQLLAVPSALWAKQT